MATFDDLKLAQRIQAEPAVVHYDEQPSPHEPAVADDVSEVFEQILDARLKNLAASYAQRWAGLSPRVRDWLAEVLFTVLYDVRRDVLELVNTLLAPPTVH